MINVYISQVDRIAGQLHQNGMGDISVDDLRSLAGSLEMTINIVYGEIRHRMEREQDANPKPPSGPARGLLDGLRLPSSKGGDAA
ncbi:hypothetical protein [Bradyrhizobium erythrophlei]|uniref:Uncharacterized protein n=1 Tax=Bradyrhizobium erythrophlei TaxID=1437360 RepID=A0A1H4NHB8_9BRAD|nr:hypothetical protein [Bradyrhizobium erythrophlei]SEB94285.1 hypothetical protein SAMN05444164_0622 [Bradyrhizobium erythrophlei]